MDLAKIPTGFRHIPEQSLIFPDDINLQIVARSATDGANERSFKLLHAVSGIFLPTSGVKLPQYAQLLIDQAQLRPETLPSDFIVLGFAFGGIALAATIASVLSKPFAIISEKNYAGIIKDSLQVTDARKSEYVYNIQGYKHCILVEDEVTTGAAAIAAKQSLQSTGIETLALLAVVEVMNFEGGQKLAEHKLPLHSLLKVELTYEV